MKKNILLTFICLGHIIVFAKSKKILVLGTSITIGCNYLENTTKANNYYAYNKAIGSSGICLNTGILGNGRDGLDLSETIAEKEARYTESVTPKVLETYRNASWERVIKPYLDGTIDEVDAIWFDHGFNDRGSIYNELATLDSVDWELGNNADRTSFTGAFRYLLWQIYSIKPTVRIFITGYLENQSDNSVRGGAGIDKMLQKISDVYRFTYLKPFEHTGFNFKHLPNSKDYILKFNKKYGAAYKAIWKDKEGNITFFQLYNPDSIHPFTDLTGFSDRRLDAIYTKLLKDLL